MDVMFVPDGEDGRIEPKAANDNYMPVASGSRQLMRVVQCHNCTKQEKRPLKTVMSKVTSGKDTMFSAGLSGSSGTRPIPRPHMLLHDHSRGSSSSAVQNAVGESSPSALSQSFRQETHRGLIDMAM